MDAQPDPRRHLPQWASNVPLPEPYLFGITAGFVLHWVRPWMLPGSRNAHRVVGWSLIAAGSSLIVRSVQASRRVTLAHPDTLVTTGPYAISRNPMYLGWGALHIGVGVATGSAWVLAAFLAAIGLMHRQVRREERALGEEFGDEFERYRASVPRYVPGRPGRADN
jgi:protein-S-isoprenylcysteine O-methyltransferase Ste14